MSITPPIDQAINAWFECQSEETLRDLQDRFDAQTPRQAWEAFFNDCPPPAPQGFSDSLAAPAAAVQGVDTLSTGRVQAGAADGAAHGKRSPGAATAGAPALPDGNHGDNRRSIQ